MMKKITFLLGILSVLLFASANNLKTFTMQNNDIEITIIYPEKISQGDKIRLLGIMKNKYRNAYMGGLTISFPQLKYTKSTYSDNSFDSIKNYSPPDKIYNSTIRKNIKSKYYMIEGWENNWKSGQKKKFYIEVNVPNDINYLTINVRGVLVFGKSKKYRTEISLPENGTNEDQQGYPVGQLLIPIYSQSSTEQKTMNFTILNDNILIKKILTYGKRRIYASGVIDKHTTERFIQYVKNNHITNGLVVFNSPGGSLMEGITLGKTIRKLGFNTTIGFLDKEDNHQYEGVCASACAYAFAGGVARYIYYDRQKLGVHQFYNGTGSNNENMSLTQYTTAIIAQHLHDMGISSKAFILASSTKSNDMKWFTKQEALSLNFANNGEDITTSEIKIMPLAGKGQKPYLLIKQQKSHGIGKLILVCNKSYLDILAGITTNNEVSNQKRNTLVKNYLELDEGILLEKKGQIGTKVTKDTLWLERKLNSQQVQRLLQSDALNVWTEDGGQMRWGIQINISPVKVNIRNFLQGCNIL